MATAAILLRVVGVFLGLAGFLGAAMFWSSISAPMLGIPCALLLLSLTPRITAETPWYRAVLLLASAFLAVAFVVWEFASVGVRFLAPAEDAPLVHLLYFGAAVSLFAWNTWHFWRNPSGVLANAS